MGISDGRSTRVDFPNELKYMGISDGRSTRVGFPKNRATSYFDVYTGILQPPMQWIPSYSPG